MTEINLTVEVREGTGKGAARASRRTGNVPGVIYGGDLAPVSIDLKLNEVLKAINSGSFLANMIKITHSGKTQSVLTKDVQFHPVTDMPFHVDFFRVNESDIIEVAVSINIIGEEENVAMRGGATLNVVRHEIEVNCPAGSIPDSIDVDVSGMEIGDSLSVSELNLPENVEGAITDRDPTVVTLVAPRAEAEEEEDGEEVAADEVPTTSDEEAEGGEESEE